jgi:predicted DNA binding CopG/RHH family protein
MPVLKTLVPPDLKATFKKRAVTLSLSESDLLRVVVIEAMSKTGKSPAPLTPNSDEAETDRMTLRMPAFLLKNVRKRSKALGMSASRWVASLVQTNLMRDPVMSAVEVEVLRASNRELAAISRNLNQISRSLNDNFHEADRLKLQLIDGLQDSIKSNRAAVVALVRSSLKTWGAAE